MVFSLVRTSRDGRYMAIGRIDALVVAVIVKPLGTEALTVISLRRASRKERKLFDAPR